jgi:hypothetical protein
MGNSQAPSAPRCSGPNKGLSGAASCQASSQGGGAPPIGRLMWPGRAAVTNARPPGASQASCATRPSAGSVASNSACDAARWSADSAGADAFAGR